MHYVRGSTPRRALPPHCYNRPSVAKKALVFSCTECGAQASKWLGRCPDCNAWNSYAQEDAPGPAMPATAMSAGAPMPIDAVDFDTVPRTSTTIPSLDRVLGGGLVIGAVTLVGGEIGRASCRERV